MDYILDILDEIALEGLDGITLDALWVRLKERPDFIFSERLDDDTKEFIWNLVRRLRDVEFFRLPKPRSPFVLNNRYVIENELGIVTEANPLPEDIYPHEAVYDVKNNIMGSCTTYKTRINVSEIVRKIGLCLAYSYFGSSLVIVASQEARRNSLIGIHANPNLEIGSPQYCMLERIGRSRYHGEPTQGKSGLQALREDPKTIFYYRKFLLKHNLVTKQVFQLKLIGSNVSGLLLHLTRFYKLIKPKFISFTEASVRFLKEQPNGMADYKTLRDHLSAPGILRRLTKIADFQKFIHTDARVPYRTLHPDADIKQWKQKATEKEKRVRVVQLHDPNIDIRDVQRKLLGPVEDEDDEDEKSEGILYEKTRFMDVPLLTQCCMAIKNSGGNGVTQSQIAKSLGMTRVQSRTICKNCVKIGAVGCFMADVGRQRVSKFYLKHNDNVNASMEAFIEEKFSELVNTTEDFKTVFLNNKKITLDHNDDNIILDSCMNGNENQVSTRILSNEFMCKSEANPKASCSSTLELDNSTHLESHSVRNNDEILFLNDSSFSNCSSGLEPIPDDSISDNVNTSSIVNMEVDNDSFSNSVTDDVNVMASDSNINKITSSSKRTGEELDTPVKNKKQRLESDDVNENLSEVSQQNHNNVSSNPELTNLIEQNPNANNLEDNLNVRNFNNNEESLNNSLENSADEIVSMNEKGVSNADKIVIDVNITDDFHWLLPKDQLRKEMIRLNQNNQIACKSLKTYRLLKRSNLIIEAVHESKVINDVRKLVLMINEAEYREGQACRMDKKSLLRILFRLALDKHIKIYRVTLKSGVNIKYLDFICDSKITSDHPVIKSAVEFARLKFQTSLAANHNTLVERNNIGPSMKRFVDVETRKMAIFYPKFNRMKVIHRFLFYLVYNYEGDENQDQDIARLNLRKEYDLTEDVTNLMSFVYYPKADWRMFVPPLPKYAKEGEVNGWSLLSDALIRLPLSLFTQLVHVPYYCPDIDVFLDHPIKRHLLVTKLPVKIRNCLTSSRKYIFTIYEDLARLAYIGLLQFGPQQNKDKEQIFTFINRNATLLDTTLSNPGYNKISTDVEYPVQRYKFNTLLDVDGYWISAMNICMNTRLGGRCHVLGTDIVLENVQDKLDIIKAVKQRDFSEAPLMDIGYTPGDKLGAAGFDSALYAHLKRNWHSKPSKGLAEKRPAVELITPSSRKVLDKVSSNETKDSDNQSQVIQFQQRLCNNFGKRKRIASSSSTSSLPRKISIIKKARVKPGKQSVKIRHIKPKKSLIRRPYYDQIDKEALKRMSKLRVDWSEEEDRILLICKIASAFICPDTRKQINANMFLAFREILHKTLQSSKNKTSRACQRRVAYMLRSADTCHNVNLCIEELRQDEEIVEKYGGTLEFIQKEADLKGKKIKEMENLWKKKFKELVSHLMSRYNYNFNNLSFNMRNQLNENFILPDNLKEFHENYNLLSLDKTQFKSKGRFKCITNLTDIYNATLNVTIHSTLCCNSDKTSWSYHLFSIYQQYPEKLLRNVLNKLRSNQMVSFKKSYQRNRVHSNTYLPLSASPYQLSISYINLMQTRYQSELYLDCFKFFSDAMNKMKQNDFANDKGYQVLSLTGGSTAAIIQLFCDNILEFNIDIPDQIIVLDPDVKNKDETYARLVQCYKDILSNYKRDLTCSVLFQKHNYACTVADEGILAVKGSAEGGQRSSNSESTALVAKAASRIALYLMRDDAVNTTGMIPKEMDHAHDFFVVNSCNIYVKLNSSDSKESDLLSVDVKEINSVLEIVRNTATFNDASVLVGDDESNLGKVLKENFSDYKYDLAVSILNKMREKTFHGLTNAELISDFGNSFKLVDILNRLVKLDLALCTGVVFTRYVYYTYVRAWVVNSYRNVRCEKDARKPLNKGPTISFSNASGLDINESCLDDDNEKKSKSGVVTIRTDLYQPEASTSKKCNETDSVNSSQNKTTDIKSLPEKSDNFDNHWGLHDEDYKKLIRHNMSHPIKVVMRPWIRVDGTLNRRVFDMILTSVLSHIMLNPGVSLLSLQNRFSPAYLPRHITEVCNALMKIKCISRYHVTTTSKPTLTSKPCAVLVNDNPTGLERENEICYEPMKFAILNLGKFIGTNLKPYSEDFIKCLLGR